MGINDNPLGVSGTTISGLGDQNGALYQFLKQTSGGSSNAQRAIDLAGMIVPQQQEANPWEAAFQYFAEMGRQASQPGATALGAAAGSMQVPLDYLNAKKKEKRETDRARMQTALTLGASLKPAAGSGKVTYRPATAAELLLYGGATAGQVGSDGKFYDLSKTASTAENDLKPFGLIDPENLAEIQRVIPSASLDADGNILLTGAEAAMAGVRPYIGQKITPSKDPAKEPKFSDDGTGTLRYTANPPEGKNIGDIVFEGVDITGFTQNELQLANSLRDDLTKQIEPFRDIRSSFSQIDGFYEEAQLENSPVSDYSLAVQYAKVIDPGTAAREGEVAAIATAGAMSSAFKAALTNALMGTGKLSPRMRASIYNNALRIYGTKLPGALATIERYKTQSNAQKDGLFNLVGLNVDAESYKPVGEGGYQPKDIDSLAEAPEDNSTYNFPPDFNFNSLDRNALLGLLRLPAGSLDDRTLEKIDVALGD
jgi:hypothetical protein